MTTRPPVLPPSTASERAAETYARAEALRAAGQPAKALLLYKSVLAKEPGFVAARHGLAASLSTLGRGKEAATIERYASAQEARVLCAAAAAALFDGRLAEAEEHYRRAVALSPELDEAVLGLARTSCARGRPKSALNWYRQHLVRHAEDAEVRHLVEALSDGKKPDRAPPAAVRAMFDRLADGYDTLANGDLRYCGPNLVLAAVEEAWPGHPAELLVLDAGCGTGLSGRPFRPMARRLEGVDLSPRMLAVARTRGIYDDLAVQDLCERLAATEGTYNLVVAADVLVYFGDLANVLRDTAHALRPGGHFAFTLEAQTEDGYRLNGSGRYSHGEGYLRRNAPAFGLSVALLRREPVRRDYGRQVDAWVAVLRRR